MNAIVALGVALLGVAQGVQERDSFMPAAVPARKHLQVMDLRDADPDQVLTAVTLQGLVNGTQQAALYLLRAEWDPFWLDYCTSEGFVTGHSVISFEEALEEYSSLIKTLIIPDPELPASINVATMIAAVNKGIVIPAESFPGVVQGCAERVDLRGRWKSNAEAYRWALENLLPEMNPSVLACYHPTACNHHIRDYLVQHKVFHFWVTGENHDGGPAANAAAEREVAEAVFAATAPNIPVLGFWYSGTDSGLDEYVGVGLAGEYGKITVVCDWATNLSLLGGIRVDLEKAVEKHALEVEREPPVLEPHKVYLCVDIVESGDSPSYVQTRMHTIWKDPQRGAVPINWSLGPAILDLAPPLAHYFYQTATKNDYLYMAISGAGYCQPYRLLFTKTPDPERAWKQYLDFTSNYLKRMQCHTMGLYTDAWKHFDRDKHDRVTKRFIEGVEGIESIVLGMGRDEGIQPDNSNYYLEGHGDTLVSPIMTRWPVDYGTKSRAENIQWLVEDIQNHTPEARPGFIHIMALSWVFGPSEIKEVLDLLGDDYVPLTIPQFNALFKRATESRVN